MQNSDNDSVEKDEEVRHVLLERNGALPVGPDTHGSPGIPIDRGWAWMTVLGKRFDEHFLSRGQVRSF